MKMKRVHFYAGARDGDHTDVPVDADAVTVHFKLTPKPNSCCVSSCEATYVYSEPWTLFFKRLTFVLSGYKGLPTNGKGVAA